MCTVRNITSLDKWSQTTSRHGIWADEPMLRTARCCVLDVTEKSRGNRASSMGINTFTNLFIDKSESNP